MVEVDKFLDIESDQNIKDSFLLLPKKYVIMSCTREELIKCYQTIGGCNNINTLRVQSKDKLYDMIRGRLKFVEALEFLGKPVV